MSQPYVGEIRLVGFNFEPVGWQLCDGSLLSIAEYSVLFNLIGTTYGGDGISTFAVPDLRGRVPVHMGPGPGPAGVSYTLGQEFGADGPGSATSVPTAFSVERNLAVTINSTANADDNASTHNREGLTFIISLFGIFPTQA